MIASAGRARIVYATFATTRRSGGVYVMSEHVRLLRGRGYAAWLWIPGPGPAPEWFDDDVPTLVGPTLDLTESDVLVLPEVPIVPGQDPAPGARTVVFNQNHFYTYAADAAAAWTSYPDWAAAPAVWTVSQESRDVLAALHPHLTVTVIPNPVASELFRPAADGPPSVAWFSRKRPREAALLHRLLTIDPRMAGVALHDITDEAWEDVARILGAATVFVSFGHTEGFGLPLAEALAAGCLVTGYDGGGGRELFEAPGAWPVPEQRPLALARQVADLVEQRVGLNGHAQANRAWVRERYGPANTLAALVPAVEATSARPGVATTATHPARWLDRVPAGFHLTG